jgi:hypothetical protein
MTAHKIAVAIAFVVLTAWLLFGSLLPPPYQQAEERGEYSTKDSSASVASPKSSDDRIADYTWWVAAFTFALSVVSAFQIFFLIRADETTRLTAEAAKKSADASLLALRPWVSCEAKIISDLTYRPNGDPCITIRFILKNTGHSPAMGVRLIQWFHLLSPVHTLSIHVQQRIADLLKGLPAQERGLLLFPGKTHVSDIELPISRIEIEKSIEDIKPKKHFFPELIGVVTYTYPLASHNPQTGFIFHLEKIVPDETSGFAFDLDEPTVPAGNITLRAHGLWSEYAT